MSLTPSTFATALKSEATYPATEAAAITALADSWDVYWEESVAEYLAVDVSANSTPAAARVAFEAALVGISTTTNTAVNAATYLKNACKAFWTVAIPALAYTTTPPPLGPYVGFPAFMLNGTTETALVTAMASAFTANMVDSETRDDAIDAFTSAIDGGVQSGATFLDTTTPGSGGPFLYVVS